MTTLSLISASIISIFITSTNSQIEVINVTSAWSSGTISCSSSGYTECIINCQVEAACGCPTNTHCGVRVYCPSGNSIPCTINCLGDTETCYYGTFHGQHASLMTINAGEGTQAMRGAIIYAPESKGDLLVNLVPNSAGNYNNVLKHIEIWTTASITPTNIHVICDYSGTGGCHQIDIHAEYADGVVFLECINGGNCWGSSIESAYNGDTWINCDYGTSTDLTNNICQGIRMEQRNSNTDLRLYCDTQTGSEACDTFQLKCDDGDCYMAALGADDKQWTCEPTSVATCLQWGLPTVSPTSQPTQSPVPKVTNMPTYTPVDPTGYPTTAIPTIQPSEVPTSVYPSDFPSDVPTNHPTSIPTTNPTVQPSNSPPTTSLPTTSTPTTETPTTSSTTTSTTNEPTTSTTQDPTTSTTNEPTSSTAISTGSPTESTTINAPTTSEPTSASPTTEPPTTSFPSTIIPSTSEPTTYTPTTSQPTLLYPTTANPLKSPTTINPTIHPTTSGPTLVPTTASPTTTLPSSNPTIFPTPRPTTKGLIAGNRDQTTTRSGSLDSKTTNRNPAGNNDSELQADNETSLGDALYYIIGAASFCCLISSVLLYCVVTKRYSKHKEIQKMLSSVDISSMNSPSQTAMTYSPRSNDGMLTNTTMNACRLTTDTMTEQSNFTNGLASLSAGNSVMMDDIVKHMETPMGPEDINSNSSPYGDTEQMDIFQGEQDIPPPPPVHRKLETMVSINQSSHQSDYEIEMVDMMITPNGYDEENDKVEDIGGVITPQMSPVMQPISEEVAGMEEYDINDHYDDNDVVVKTKGGDDGIARDEFIIEGDDGDDEDVLDDGNGVTQGGDDNEGYYK